MQWTWAAASCRGTSHVQAGTRCQDAHSVSIAHGDAQQLVAVLCDGAGSAQLGGQGAALTTRCMSQQALAYFRIHCHHPSDEDVLAWVENTRNKISELASSRRLTPRDFATTLILVLSNATETLVIHVGDGSVVLRDAVTQRWQALSWPAHGEYASSTNFITDAPDAVVRIERCDGPTSSIVAFTDGLERLALNFAEKIAHAPFFSGIVAPLDASLASGRDPSLSAQLAAYLDGKAVNDRTDDDKTLMIAVLR